jgi:hypothetical protein
MFSAGKVIFGLVVFLGIATFPLWYNGAVGNAGNMPDLTYPDPAVYGTQCILDKEYMKHSHMDLLNKWRDDVVRRGERIHETDDGRKYVMSLQNTCMGCHTQKAQFCDHCHDYAGVKPYCWQCHIEPKESI